MNRLEFSQSLSIAFYTLIQEMRNKHASSGKPSYRILISLCIMYLFSGVAAGAVFLSWGADFAASFCISTLFAVLIANLVLIEFPTLVTGPEDLAFYSSLPIKPETYFFGKILSVLLIVLGCGAIFSVPVALFLFAGGGTITGFLGIELSVFVSGIASVLIIINLLASVVRIAPLSAIRSVASALQFILIIACYGAFVLLAGVTGKPGAMLDFGLVPQIIFFPSAWASSVFLLNEGIVPLILFAFSLVCIPALAYAARKIVSLEFASVLAELDARSRIRKGERKKLFFRLWKSDEDKAVAILLVSHLKHDQQFRISILTIIPISAIYFIIVFLNSAGSINDPFTLPGILTFPQTIPIYVAIGFFPFYLKNALSYSSDAEAGWIFYVSPYNRIKLIDSVRKFVHLFFSLPYFAVMIALFMVLSKSVIGVLLHFIVVFLLYAIQLDIFFYFFAEIPFSRKYRKGKTMLTLYLRMLLAPLLPLPLFLFVYFLYGDRLRFAALLAGLTLVMLLVRRTGKRLAIGRLSREEYRYGM